MNSQSNKIRVGGILENRDLVMVSILSAPNIPGTAGKILSLLGDFNINVEFITESCNIEDTADIVFCFKSADRDTVLQILPELTRQINPRAEKWQDHIAIISVYGPHFREKPSIAGRMCSALGAADINILGISTSISTVSCVISESQMELAKQALESAFNLPE